MSRNSHPIRNLLLSLAVAIIGLSAYEFYHQGVVTWHRNPQAVLQNLSLRVQSLWQGRQQEAPFVEERSEPAARVLDRPDTGSLNQAYSDPGVARFELVGRVTRVIDGDSIEVQVHGKEFTVRLFGIDTPEFNQPWGDEASRALTRKVDGRNVAVSIEDIDDYGRLVGTVYQQGHNINWQMVAEGHAWWYQRYARSQRELERAQQSAQDAAVGLWQAAGPVAPWEWRRNH